MDNMQDTPDLSTANRLSRHANWRKRLEEVTEMMREMSSQTDPQEMVRQYGKRVREMFPVDAFISISRRDMDHPSFMVTRASVWEHELDPSSAR